MNEQINDFVNGLQTAFTGILVFGVWVRAWLFGPSSEVLRIILKDRSVVNIPVWPSVFRCCHSTWLEASDGEGSL